MTSSAPAAKSCARRRQAHPAAHAQTAISRLRRQHRRPRVEAIAARAAGTAVLCVDSGPRARVTDAGRRCRRHGGQEQRHVLLEATGREQKAGQEARGTRHGLEQRPRTARRGLRCAGERITGCGAVFRARPAPHRAA
ncbi:hypothetical protein [Streptomyces sp. GESEQ-4]|uniref:hypothetical protein n=1 Tax=Streptomyces sp. GESEQ-4 TaxID=2812655 RepID=UPI001B31B47D|nr:hypothetical protein [Streptomyces sp. GESEQ-4]